MQFSDWFNKQGDLTQAAVAEQLGVTQGRVAQLLRGDLPSMALAIRIRAVTAGDVTPNDWGAAQRDTSSPSEVSP